MTVPEQDPFDRLFEAQFPRLQRYLDRLSGDGELARDLAQESFLRLYRRSGLPDRPEAWLITVATNL
ncbi:MAG: sigma factor, partial [Gemmatimonadota bacterium]|nr:sigma factor [Gemmatimonadota bacterium]